MEFQHALDGAAPAAAPPPAAALHVALEVHAGNARAAAIAAAAAPAAPAHRPAPSFASQLASATPDQRKHMIGEQLYTLIARSQGGRAGKITGMLLEGMDERELLHLLESPADLEERIREALGVLAKVAGSGKA
jgi:polyadenylate-binding protein